MVVCCLFLHEISRVISVQTPNADSGLESLLSSPFSCKKKLFDDLTTETTTTHGRDAQYSYSFVFTNTISAETQSLRHESQPMLSRKFRSGTFNVSDFELRRRSCPCLGLS